MTESEKPRSWLSDAFTVNSYKLGSLAARAMPGPVAGVAASMIGLTLSGSMRDKRVMIERNLKRANPALRGLELRQAVQYWAYPRTKAPLNEFAFRILFR